MLLKHIHNNKTFRFIEKSYSFSDDENVFTIVVGKNGTGKSRLLSGIVQDCFGLQNRRHFNRQHFREITPSDRLSFDSEPSKIICVSTSPFDKFPLSRTNTQSKFYSYLGLRGLQSIDFGRSYLARVIVSLMSAVMDDWEQMNEIVNVLNYLGYTDRIKIRIRRMLISSTFEKNFRKNDLVSDIDFERLISHFGFSARNFFRSEDDDLNKEHAEHFFNIIKKLGFENLERNIELELNQSGIFTDSIFQNNIRDLLFLIKAGALVVQDISLEKQIENTQYSISEASSGEQSVVMGILGLASQISHGSLILIDEPEICLHPEWQERYIKMLISTFRYYKGCHFIIATHSPQIVANLESKNCFILSMEDRRTISASTVNNNSVDYQLAKIFNSPGFKNEYLNRIAMNTFVKVGKQKLFEADDLENYNLLSAINVHLNDNDPVKELISALQVMKEYYA